MALKADRVIIETDITLTCPVASPRGFGLVISTAGSGVALGDSAGAATLAANPSGSKFAGLLLNDVVSIDETRYHRNFHKQEQKTGERVTLLRKGRVTTDAISGTPTPGAPAYLTTNGNFTPTKSTGGGLVATPGVGEFKSGLDENGFATIEVNVPSPAF